MAVYFHLFRDKLVNLQPSTGYCFDGNGYTIVSSKAYRVRERSDVPLKFKTTARDGLLFLTGKGHTFLSIELRDDNVLYQVWYFI
jgi:laminin alpha 3/5